MVKYLSSSVFRWALAYAAIGVAALGLFAAVMWFNTRTKVEQALGTILTEEAQRLVELSRDKGVGALEAAIRARVDNRKPGEEILLLADASLKPLAGNLAAWPSDIGDAGGPYRVIITRNGRTGPMIAMRMAIPGGYALLVGRDIDMFKPARLLFFYGLAGGVGVILALGVLGGLLIRRGLLSRVQAISHTASAIVDGDLARRLPMRGTADELDELAGTINRMLDQIEQLVHGVRNVSNAIAHDLRTPLTELRSRLEELSVVRPPSEETFAEVDGAVADVDRLIAIFNALLRLAEIDSGARRSGFREVDIADLVTEAVELYQPAAELTGTSLTLRCAGRLVVSGDPYLLAQAVSNLIDNALKYTAVKGSVIIEVERGSHGGGEVSVADSGPGISAAEKPRVTERFYRGDASKGTSGIGLGLSLVAAVAKLHGGSLELADNHPGLRATLKMASRPAG